MRLAIATVLAAATLASPAMAAFVAWQGPVTVSRSTDVLTLGTLHGAISANADAVTVNGVLFSGLSQIPEILQGFGDHIFGMGVPDLANASYNQLLSAIVFRPSSDGPAAAFEAFSLTPGHSYATQIWQPFWDANWATRYSADGIVSARVSSSGRDAGAGVAAQNRPQYVIGTFVADSTSMSFDFRSTTEFQTFGAVQIRDITGVPLAAVPEPETWGMLILGLGLVGSVKRGQRNVAA